MRRTRIAVVAALGTLSVLAGCAGSNVDPGPTCTAFRAATARFTHGSFDQTEFAQAMDHVKDLAAQSGSRALTRDATALVAAVDRGSAGSQARAVAALGRECTKSGQ